MKENSYEVNYQVSKSILKKASNDDDELTFAEHL